MKKIGILFADPLEFEPFRKFALENGGAADELYGYRAAKLTVTQDAQSAELIALEFGIGKVCAAAACAVMIHCIGADGIILAGLSGAVSGLVRGDIVASSRCCECDMDLTPLNYQPGQKPDYPLFYDADADLLRHAQKLGLKTGILGTGDIFLTDPVKKNLYRESFGICSFDMESAAVGSVCYKHGARFISIRKISDSADDSAAEDYTLMNNKAERSLTEIIVLLIKSILSE